MAEIRKEPTKTQKIFRKLNPASWFSRKKETAPSPRSDPLPQLSPELERDFSNMHIGLMMDKLIPVSREYRLGKTGDARKKMDVADALVARAKDSFGAMKSTNNHANPGVAQMYPQHYRNATKNLQDAIQLYAYAAARLADGSDLKSQVSQKIKECETLLETINQYHNGRVAELKK